VVHGIHELFIADTPELTVATVLAIGIVAVVKALSGPNVLLVLLFPLMVVAGLAFSLRRGLRDKRRSSRREDGHPATDRVTRKEVA
jgi:hypothetical protein